ncbi:MAG: DNA polymerase/3'-5' exonuclease PolX [Bacteroidota bacterium]
MPVHNKDIADILFEIADLLDLKGENEFRIRSYRDAARTISEGAEDIVEMAGDEEDISTLPGIGESMAEKIREIAKTGKLKQLEELRKEIPSSLTEIMHLEQMGPEKTRILNKELGIESIDDLKKAAEEGKIEELKGFGRKTKEKILKEIEEYSEKGGSERFKLVDADKYSGSLTRYLEKKVKNLTLAGSTRRRKETVGDIDLVASANKSEEAMKYFTKFEDVKEVLVKGETKSSVKLKSGLQIDLRLVKKRSIGAAVLYSTGSRSHTLALRKKAKDKNLKLSEYGVFKGKRRLAGKTEKDIYKKLGLSYIEPELRENKGEIEAAEKDQLPDLLKLSDIKGDLQSHTKASDGKYSLKEMADKAKDLGYEYLAITEHSKRVSMANGLDAGRLREQLEKIDKLNEDYKGFKILKSIEVDILDDGKLDLSDEVLKELDIVICSIHYNLNLSGEKQTKRILKAMDNEYFNILAHPTGRRLGERGEMEFDLVKIMREAKKRNCFLEINAHPDRLDLKDEYIRKGKEEGIKMAISTDAHSLANLENMKYGLAQARRGWLEKKDVINTRSWKNLKKILKRN